MPAWNPQANDIFLDALEIASPIDRKAFIERTCAGDTELQGQVASLLEASRKAGSFLETPPSPVGIQATATLDQSIPERPGETIGRYKLLQEIGAGGMGVVYMAEQREPVRRKVALKIIKPGMDTRQVVARFEAERQALAMMDHPNISRVLDGGTTDSGRPYFVMELVHGIPLTEYCDQNQLTTRERLELFVSVCQAVQHAHTKGIIHRDLKPSHVMVTLFDGVPVPKIIDFGIAKATTGQLTDKTCYTSYGQVIGTPLYMSPEQAELSALDVDTRSDIYSLGLVLYELLTGSTPFDRERMREASYDEIRRMIREEDPPRPSARISTLGVAATTVSTQRKTDPAKLCHLLRHDLDWIVMKALQKDRARRYQTASDFTSDIQRYLGGETVAARPPSLLDGMAKWARRHRPVVWSAIASLFVVLAALGISTVLVLAAYEGEKREHALADTNAKKAEQNAASAAANAAKAAKNYEMARKAIQQMLAQVDDKRLDQIPEIRKVRDQLYEDAVPFFTGLIELNSGDAQAYVERADLYMNLGKAAEELRDREKAVEIDPQNAEFQWRLGADLEGTLDYALRDYNRALFHAKRAAELRPDLTRYQIKVASVLANLGRAAEARDKIEKISKLQLGSWEYQDLSRLYATLGDNGAALVAIRKAVELAPTHSFILQDFAGLLHARGDNEEALAAINRAIASFPTHHSSWSGAMSGTRAAIYSSLLRSGNYTKILADIAQAVELYPDDYTSLDWVTPEQAAKCPDWFRNGLLELADKVVQLRDGDPDAYAARASVYDAFDRHKEGVAIFYDLARKCPGNPEARFLLAREMIAGGAEDKEIALLDKLLKGDLAAPQYAKDLAKAYFLRGNRFFSKDDWDFFFGNKQFSRDDLAAALPGLRKAVELDPTNSHYLYRFAQILRLSGDSQQALEAINRAIKNLSNPLSRGNWSYYYVRSGIYRDRQMDASALPDLDRVIEADPSNSEAYARRAGVNFRLGHNDNGLADINKALELTPGAWWHYAWRGSVYFRLGDYEKALADIAKAVELNPGDYNNLTGISLDLVAKCPDERFRKGLLELADKTVRLRGGDPGAYAARASVYVGAVYAGKEDWDKANEELTKAIEIAPDNTDLRYQCALARLAAGRSDEYRKGCGEMLARFAPTANPNDAYWTAWTCALAPDSVADWSKPLALAERAVKGDPKSPQYVTTLGAVLVRAGRLEDAIQRLEEADRLAPHPTESATIPPAYSWFFLAMAHQRLGHREQAKARFDKADEWTDNALGPSGGDAGASLAWKRRLTLKLFRAEAAESLGIPERASPAKDKPQEPK